MSNIILLDGMILMWFVLTALSVLFVVVDIRNTPEDNVLKWGFILLTAYIGPFGAFLYVLGCREPLPGTHEQYIATRWRQVLGSTMHCVAGDGVGILVGAVIGALIHLGMFGEMFLEYVLGFVFGWTIFQALAMKAMLGTYKQALSKTFYAELVSMNWLMAGMMPIMMISMRYIQNADDPTSPRFWFVMSMSLLVGFIAAYPINWWLVSNNLKHGMMTVRFGAMSLEATKMDDTSAEGKKMSHAKDEMDTPVPGHNNHQATPAKPSMKRQLVVAGISFAILIVGIKVGMIL